MVIWKQIRDGLLPLTCFLSVMVIFISLKKFIFNNLEDYADLLFFIAFLPAFLIILGRLADQVLQITSKIVILNQSLTSFPLLITTYFLLGLFFIFLLKNSILKMYLEDFNNAQLVLIGVSLALLPRIVQVTGGERRARQILLTLLTPLIVFAAPAILISERAFVYLSASDFSDWFYFSIILFITTEFSLYIFREIGLIYSTWTIKRITSVDLITQMRKKEQDFDWVTLFEICLLADFQKNKSVKLYIESETLKIMKGSQRSQYKYWRAQKGALRALNKILKENPYHESNFYWMRPLISNALESQRHRSLNAQAAFVAMRMYKNDMARAGDIKDFLEIIIENESSTKLVSICKRAHKEITGYR